MNTFTHNCTSVGQKQDNVKSSYDCEEAAGRFSFRSLADIGVAVPKRCVAFMYKQGLH